MSIQKKYRAPKYSVIDCLFLYATFISALIFLVVCLKLRMSEIFSFKLLLIIFPTTVGSIVNNNCNNSNVGSYNNYNLYEKYKLWPGLGLIPPIKGLTCFYYIT